jgi:hypothetical protein
LKRDGKIQASGDVPVLSFDKGAPVAVTAISANEFFIEAGDHACLAFERDHAGKPARLILNPGPWQITGERIHPCQKQTWADKCQTLCPKEPDPKDCWEI